MSLRVKGDNRRLAVLVATSGQVPNHALREIGSCMAGTCGSLLDDIASLLSAANITFDIIAYGDISTAMFSDTLGIRYTTVIIVSPLSSLTDAAVAVLQDVSARAGISLLAFYDHPDSRSRGCFGIDKVRGKRALWPLRVRIDQFATGDARDAVADYSPVAGIAGIRRRGLGKLSLPGIMRKGLRHLQGLAIPYLNAQPVPGVRLLATAMDSTPLAWSHRHGNATNYYFALHDGRILSKFNEMHRLVRGVIEVNSGFGMVSVDLSRTMVLRLDDPGACTADYLAGGCTLEEGEWQALGEILRHNDATLSVMYTPCWVDDGDAGSGTLFLNGHRVDDRRSGRIHDSAAVRYHSNRSPWPDGDHASEYRGLKRLTAEGTIDIHSHGKTHLVPDYGKWARSASRRSDARWYHEFFDVRRGKTIGTEEQYRSMADSRERISTLFGISPAVLTPSGHRHDADSDRTAIRAGYRLFSSDYTAILKEDRVVRNWKIPALFLSLKAPNDFFLRCDYPFVGVLHDYELKPDIARLADIIGNWQRCGVTRLISMKSLVAALCSSLDARVMPAEGQMALRLLLPRNEQTGAIDSALPGAEIRLAITLPQGASPSTAIESLNGATLVATEYSGRSRRLGMALRIGHAPAIDLLLRTNYPAARDKRKSAAGYR